MPVHFHISSALNVILFVCEGSVTGPDFFYASNLAMCDESFQYGMLIVIDLFAAKDRFELEDIRRAVERMNRNAEEGNARSRIVVLSRSTGIHLLIEMITLLPSKVELRIQAYQTLEEAIVSLGLWKSKKNFIQFWKENGSSGEF